MTASNWQMVQDLIEEIAIRPAKECRRFGLEIETPNANQINHYGFTITTDPSVSTNDCECDCETCTHSCNCPSCEIADYNEDHCEDCTGNELALEYENGDNTTGNGVIKEVCQRLAENNSEHEDRYRDHPYGGHIHVEARDLTNQQLANLLRAYRHAQKLFPTKTFFGREPNDYCSTNTDNQIQETAQGWNIDRMSAVNTQNVLEFQNRCQNYPDRYNQTTKYKSTVEFRQFASTNDWKLTLTRIAFCIALVEYIAKGHPMYWLLRTTTWQEFAREIQI